MVEFMMGAFGFSKLEINLSTRPAKAVGSDEIWEKAEAALKEALQAKVWPFPIKGPCVWPLLMTRSYSGRESRWVRNRLH